MFRKQGRMLMWEAATCKGKLERRRRTEMWMATLRIMGRTVQQAAVCRLWPIRRRPRVRRQTELLRKRQRPLSLERPIRQREHQREESRPRLGRRQRYRPIRQRDQ